MTEEEKYLVDICRDYLSVSKLHFKDDINYTALAQLIKHHNLYGVAFSVFNQCDFKNKLNAKFFSSLQDKFFDCVYIYECQNKSINEIDMLLASRRIEHIFFKGAVIRNFYPVSETRSMGDIDMLIHLNDRSKVNELLKRSGYICTESNGAVHNWRKNNVLIEVHTKLITEFGDDAFDNAFDNSEFDNYSGTLNPNFHFAYLIAHIAHHFKFYGAGIRHILDLAIMLKSFDISLEKVLEILKPLNLDSFAKVILSVCYKWFNEGKDYRVDTSKTEDYLCKCGAFGSLQENKGAIITRKEMEAGKSSKFWVKLHLAFPPYKKLKNINYIKFIDGRPWLTPYAWVYRFFYNLKNRRKFVADTLNDIDDENTKQLAKQELDFFKEIGLL